MTAPDVNADVRARFEAWCQQGGWNIHNPNLLKAFEGGYRAAHADLSGEVRELVGALQELRYACTDKAERMADAALAKFTQEKP